MQKGDAVSPSRNPSGAVPTFGDENSLHTHARNAESILSHTPFLLARCSADLRLIYVSPAYARMIGRSPTEITGKPIIEVMGQEGFNTILPFVQRVLAGEHVEYETLIPYRDVGSRLLHVTYIPEHDATGKVQGWVPR